MDGEVPRGRRDSKIQSVAFVWPVSTFESPDCAELKCWRIDDNVVGLARLSRRVRNCVWRRMFSGAALYLLVGRRRWTDVAAAMLQYETFETGTQRQALNDAKRALRVFRENNTRLALHVVTRDLFREYVAALRLMGSDELDSD